MAEQITARIALSRAFRAAAYASMDDLPMSIPTALRDLAEMAQEEESAAAVARVVAVLLRELAPEPDGELAEAEQAAFEFAGYEPLMGVLLGEYYRARAAEVHERARAQDAIDESMRRGAQIATRQDEIHRLRAEVESLRETVERLRGRTHEIQAEEMRKRADLDREIAKWRSTWAEAERYVADMVAEWSASGKEVPGTFWRYTSWVNRATIFRLAGELASLREAVAAAGARDAAAQAVVTATRALPTGALTGHVDLAYALDDLRRVRESAPAATTRERLAEAIAQAMDHERDDDTPECQYVDDTLGCRCPGGHPPVPGCESCGEDGWPCALALSAADAVLALLGVSAPAAVALPWMTIDDEAVERAAEQMVTGLGQAWPTGDESTWTPSAVKYWAEYRQSWRDAARAVLEAAAGTTTRARMADHPPTHETEESQE